MAWIETNRLIKTELSKKKHRISQEELVRLKEISLDILRDVVAICNREHIPYMLGGGTALGAVRHHGFIPWDDDIDLNIPRKYIGLLLEKISSEYGDAYYIEEPVHTPGYLSSFIQIHKNGTVFREYLAQKKTKCGVKIDIFPIENTYSNSLHRFWHGVQCEAGLLILSCYRMFAWRKEYRELARGNCKAALVVGFKGLVGMFFAPAHNFWYKRVQHCLQKCQDETSDYVVMPSGRKHFFGEIYERASFMQLTSILFEGEEYSITQNYDDYLKQLFGDDYMQLPPEAEREHHMLYQLEL